MREEICCFTGHRFIANDKLTDIQKLLENEVVTLINQGVVCFFSGGAIGFDLLAAETILQLKYQFPQIQLHMILPCKNQDKYWDAANKSRYRDILLSSDDVKLLSQDYYNGCMLVRNRYMVDNSKYCIAYLTQNRGGTLYTVNYARKHNAEVIYIM